MPTHLELPAGSLLAGEPAAEALARECLSLPIFPGMRDDEIERVVMSVTTFFDGA